MACADFFMIWVSQKKQKMPDFEVFSQLKIYLEVQRRLKPRKLKVDLTFN